MSAGMQGPSHGEVSQIYHPSIIDDPIVISDSDDTSDTISSVQVIHFKYFQLISGDVVVEVHRYTEAKCM